MEDYLEKAIERKLERTVCLRVLKKALRQCNLDVVALPPGPEPQSEAEKQVTVMMVEVNRQQSIVLENETKDYIDRLIEMQGSMKEKFMELASQVFQDGVTWGKIILLLHIAGRMAVKVVEAKQPQLVIEIFKITLNYFKEKLLGWVARKGGWSSCLSELSGRMQAMPSRGQGRCQPFGCPSHDSLVVVMA
ncbi:unnamed protein product [Arctogadus glacialis]